MRLLFMFMQNPWQCLVWWVDGGFNGDTLQQGKFEGYGSQYCISVASTIAKLPFSIALVIEHAVTCYNYHNDSQTKL